MEELDNDNDDDDGAAEKDEDRTEELAAEDADDPPAADDEGAMDDDEADCDADDDATTLEDCGTPDDVACEAEVPALLSDVPLRASKVEPTELEGTPLELLEDAPGRVRHRPASQVSLSAHCCGLLQVLTQAPFSSTVPSEQRDWQAIPAAPRAMGSPRMASRT